MSLKVPPFGTTGLFQQPHNPWYTLLFTGIRHNPVGHPHKTRLWRMLEFGGQIWYSKCFYGLT